MSNSSLRTMYGARPMKKAWSNCFKRLMKVLGLMISRLMPATRLNILPSFGLKTLVVHKEPTWRRWVR